MNLKEAVRSSYFAQGLSEGQLESLYALAELRPFDAGEEILREFDDSRDLMILANGSAKVMTVAGELVGQIKAGMPMGEIAFLDGRPIGHRHRTGRLPRGGFPCRPSDGTHDELAGVGLSVSPQYQQGPLRPAADGHAQSRGAHGYRRGRNRHFPALSRVTVTRLRVARRALRNVCAVGRQAPKTRISRRDLVFCAHTRTITEQNHV